MSKILFLAKWVLIIALVLNVAASVFMYIEHGGFGPIFSMYAIVPLIVYVCYILNRYAEDENSIKLSNIPFPKYISVIIMFSISFYIISLAIFASNNIDIMLFGSYTIIFLYPISILSVWIHHKNKVA
jgi:hypothetical protein